MATNPFDKYLQNGLADFAGLRVSGTVPVKQEILNDLLQTVLADLQSPSPSEKAVAVAATTNESKTSSGVDPKSFLKYLKKAEVRAEAGRLVLDFDISITAPDA